MSNEVGGGLTIRPTIFDIGLYIFATLSPIFFLKPWNLNMAQGWFFVFGILALLGLSFISPRQVDYKNKFIGFIILWSLMNVFIHTFNSKLGQGTPAQFINFCMLSEGFIYVLCGCLLFYLVVSYKKNFQIFYPILIINILNMFFAVTQKLGAKLIWINNQSISGMMGTCSQLALFSALSVFILEKKHWALALIPIICLFLANSYTGILALSIVALINFIHKKQYKKLAIFGILTLSFIVMNYSNMLAKLMIRFEQWGYTLKEIVNAPVFGHGFDNTLTMNKIFSGLNGGYTYRHNDYLNIGRDLGVIFLAILIIGLWKILCKSKIDYLWCAIMVVVIGIFFQTNLYWTRMASPAILLLALKEQECLIC